MGKILLLGKTGYIGSAFVKEMEARGSDFMAISRKDHDYTWMEVIKPLIFNKEIELVINCAAFIPKESVSLCDKHQSETITANVMLPAKLAHLCEFSDTAFAHISTGCLWSDGKEHSEGDLPQRCFTGHCGFYIGTKWLSEEEVRQWYKHYICRIRLPFDEFNNDRNYLSKLALFPKVWDHCNSISHRSDFVKACLDLWESKASFGTYHVTNPGSVRAVDIVEKMLGLGLISKPPEIVTGQMGDCQLSTDRLLSKGVKIRPVMDALEESLHNWKSAYVPNP